MSVLYLTVRSVFIYVTVDHLHCKETAVKVSRSEYDGVKGHRISYRNADMLTILDSFFCNNPSNVIKIL